MWPRTLLLLAGRELLLWHEGASVRVVLRMSTLSVHVHLLLVQLLLVQLLLRVRVAVMSLLRPKQL